MKYEKKNKFRIKNTFKNIVKFNLKKLLKRKPPIIFKVKQSMV